MSGEHKIGGGARELSDLVPAFHDREAELIRQLDGARLMSLQYLKELESEREKRASLVEAAEYVVEMEALGNPVRCHRLKEAIAKIKESK